MEIIMNQKSLSQALKKTLPVVGRRNTVPILDNIRLEADAGQLSLTSANTDMNITISDVACEVAQAGIVTIPARKLSETVKSSDAGSDIEIHCSEDHASITIGRSSWSLPCLPAETFPTLVNTELPVRFALPAMELKSLLDTVCFASSTEETRYYLNGVHFCENDDGYFCAVATDGHRLALSQMDIPDGAQGMPSITLPNKAVGELRKLLKGETGLVRIALSETCAEFTFGSVKLTSKLIDGSFPDYERVIPEESDTPLYVDADQLGAVIKRIANPSKKSSHPVILGITSGLMDVTARNTDGSGASETLEVDYDGEPLEIRINARYLLDIATQLAGQTMEMDITDSLSAFAVRAVGNDTDLIVQMPMRA